MRPSVLDPCLFCKLSRKRRQGIQDTQVDDTLGGRDDEFVALQKETSETFECIPRKKSLPFHFNCFWVDNHDSGGCISHQKDYSSDLREITSSDSSESGQFQKTFGSGRENIAFASHCTRPETYFENSQLFQVIVEIIAIKSLSIMKNPSTAFMALSESYIFR